MSKLPSANAFWRSLLLAACLAGLAPLFTSQRACGDQASITRLTDDGRSYTEFGGGCAPVGDRVVFYKQQTESMRELWVLEVKSRKARRVSSLGYPCNATWSRDGTKLAFIFANALEESSEASVLVYDVATGEVTRTALVRQLKDFRVPEGRPWWSPDGSRFAIEVKRDDEARSIFLVPADGSPAVELAPNNPDNFFSFSLTPNIWSLDGFHLIFVGKDPASRLAQIWIADAQGQNLRTLTKPLPDLCDIAWSWDGRRIAFGTSEGRLEDEQQESYLDLWVVHADGSNPHPITHGSDPAKERRTYWMTFHWTRDNRYVMAWFSRSDDLGEYYRGFALVDPDTEELIPVFNCEVGSSEGFYGMWHGWADSWDGKRIAFTGSRYTIRGARGGELHFEDERRLLQVFAIDQRKMEELLVYRPAEDGTTISPWQSAPSWTPDSRHLVVTMARVISAEEGKFEPDLYLMDVGPPPEAPRAAVEPQPAAVPAEAVAPGAAAIIVPQNRRASEIAEALPDAHRGLYTVDPGLNALILSATDEEALAALRRDVALLDQTVPQIMVDVLVTELSNDASRQLGLDWEYLRGSLSAVLPLVGGEDAGQVIYRGVGTFDKSFFATLAALEERGQANVRANPRVLARGGSQATINIRRTDNFFYDAGTDYQGHPVRARSDISADIILRITPQLLGSGRVAMQVDATVDSFIFGGRDELPDTTRRQAVTDVVCGDGETIVIGGLTQEEEAIKRQKTPLLGDLPLLGQLFRRTTRSTKQSTLVIFITPRLISRDTGASTP